LGAQMRKSLAILAAMLTTGARAFDATPLMSFFASDSIQYGNELDATHPLPTVWDSSLIGKWSLNTNAVDSKGGNDLTWQGTQTYSNGIAGTKCGYFNGSSNAKKVSPSGMPAANAAFTVSLWIKSGSFTAPVYPRCFSIGKDSTYTFQIVVFDHKVFLHDANTGNMTGGPAIDDDQWHHIVVIWYGGANGPSAAFVDGTAISLTGTPLANPTGAGISALRIGSGRNDSDYYTGHIDDVALWNVALTTQQVISIWNSSKQPWR
jgi:hypothetical protein